MSIHAAERSIPGPRVVALGDSITLGIGDATHARIGAGWAAHFAQASVALDVAVIVVERLEMVDIDHQDGDWMAQADSRFPLLRQPLVE